MKTKRNFILFFLILILLCAAILLLRSQLTRSGKTARIYQSGNLIREVSLDTIREPIEFEIPGSDRRSNTVRAERGRIRMLHANCPDKICVHQGWIDNGVVPIVCLPNQITIEIIGAAGETDA